MKNIKEIKALPDWVKKTQPKSKHELERATCLAYHTSPAQFIVVYSVLHAFPSSGSVGEYDHEYTTEIWLFDQILGRKHLFDLEHTIEGVERVHFSRSGKSIIFRIWYEDPGYPEDNKLTIKPILISTIFG